MDLSGGTTMVPRRTRAGPIRVLSGMALQSGDLILGQVAVATLGEIPEHHRADAYPLQVDEVQAHGGARPSYDAVTTLVDGQAEGGFARGNPRFFELGGEHSSVLEGGACGEGREGRFGYGGPDGQLVLLIYLRGGVGDAMGQEAVVGKEEEAGGGRVQATHGDEAGEGWHEVADGRAAAAGLVLQSGEVAGRLVEGQVGERRGEGYGASVEEDGVPLGDGGAQSCSLAVHAHAAGRDQGLRLAAGGGGAGAGEERLQAHN